MKKGLVSIIIPTKNSSGLLTTCLAKIREQKYKKIEIIIVDGKSDDFKILEQLAKKYKCNLHTFVPKVKKGLFDATMKRNFAVKKLAEGEFVYHYDADMEISRNVISEAVDLCDRGFDAVIVTEDSFGKGPWAQAKNLERRFFWGDDSIESPRFFKKRVWNALGGYDENIAGGGDDRDIYQKMLKMGYKVGRTKSLVMHNEGKLTLSYLFKKQFMYKREVIKYIRKRPEMTIKSFSPIRASHFKKWRMFVERPKDSFFLVIMKSVEIAAGIYGITYSLFENRTGK